ncbi:DUF4907 domain-containing protein [Christiangramia crocea]|uniref:DUF4907 domain-containing protein n=1 Tax=Christiangramia crocea TaxID=2904124 RepID=A0A9X2A4U3_9FLAO|nr:DUF4907 domain-containing protein [Gramella crocea]MCG9970889.1 DUF4907 domain-containing protein [Gramella crocea]
MKNFSSTFHFSFLLFGVVVSLIMLFSGINHVIHSESSEERNLEVRTYGYGSGFGYKIISEEKLLIQQNNIPSLEQNQPFCSQGEAKKVANLVISKLERGENPAISYSELKEMQIIFKCAE